MMVKLCKQNKNQLIYSLISGTKLISFIKNKLNSNLITPSDIRDIVSSNYKIVRARKHSPQLQNPQIDKSQNDENQDKNEISIYYDANDPKYRLLSQNSLLIIVIYGQITLNHKKYAKGDYLIIQQNQFVQDQVVAYLHKPTTLVYINYQILLHRIDYFRELSVRIRQLQTCLPIDKMKLVRSQLKKIVSKISFKTLSKNEYAQLEIDEKHQGLIIVLIQGVFQVCYSPSIKNNDPLKIQNAKIYTPVYLLQKSFFYHNSNAKNFKLRSKNFEAIYVIITTDLIQQFNGGKYAISILKQIHQSRNNLKSNTERVYRYQQQKSKNIRKINKRLNTTRSQYKDDLPSQYQKNQGFSKTRLNMLSKSVPIFSTESSLQPKKDRAKYQKISDPNSGKSRFYRTTSKAWSTRSNKTVQNIDKLNFQSTYERTLEMSTDKLDRMRRYQKNKGMTKLKQQMWFSKEDLKYSINNTFYNFKSKPGQSKFENLKRTFMTKNLGNNKNHCNFTDK